MDEYVYFIYSNMNRDDISITNFVGKIGKGTDLRYKSYITPYGRNYTACIIRLENPLMIESKLLQWCRDKGYIRSQTETLYLPVSRSDTIDMCILRYKGVIDDILSKMKEYGDIEQIDLYRDYTIPVIDKQRISKDITVNAERQIRDAISSARLFLLDIDIQIEKLRDQLYPLRSARDAYNDIIKELKAERKIIREKNRNRYMGDKDIEDRLINWKEVYYTFNTCMENPSWNSYSDDNRISHIIDTFALLDIAIDTDLLTEIYWYSKVLSRREYTLDWKHAERFFYDHWNKGDKDIIQMCTIMKDEWDLYQNNIKDLVSKGVDPIQAKNNAMPEGIKRDALVRYDLLRQLLLFCDKSIDNNVMRCKFKCSLRDDDKFILLMEKFDRRFSSGIVKNKKCHKDLWNRLSYVLKNHFCIVHKNNCYYSENERYTSITFSIDDSLV